MKRPAEHVEVAPSAEAEARKHLAEAIQAVADLEADIGDAVAAAEQAMRNQRKVEGALEGLRAEPNAVVSASDYIRLVLDGNGDNLAALSTSGSTKAEQDRLEREAAAWSEARIACNAQAEGLKARRMWVESRVVDAVRGVIAASDLAATLLDGFVELEREWWGRRLLLVRLLIGDHADAQQKAEIAAALGQLSAQTLPSKGYFHSDWSSHPVIAAVASTFQSLKADPNAPLPVVARKVSIEGAA